MAVPRLSGSSGRVMPAGGCWEFRIIRPRPTPPATLFREVHPGWNGNAPVTCWGRGHAGDRHPCPELPCTEPLFTQCLLGITGVLLPPAPPRSPHAALQGWGQSPPVAVPRGSCCCGCLLLLPRDTPFNKIISVLRLLACVAAGWSQDVTPPESRWEWGAPAVLLQHSPGSRRGGRFRNKDRLLRL